MLFQMNQFLFLNKNDLSNEFLSNGFPTDKSPESIIKI